MKHGFISVVKYICMCITFFVSYGFTFEQGMDFCIGYSKVDSIYNYAAMGHVFIDDTIHFGEETVMLEKLTSLRLGRIPEQDLYTLTVMKNVVQGNVLERVIRVFGPTFAIRVSWLEGLRFSQIKSRGTFWSYVFYKNSIWQGVRFNMKMMRAKYGYPLDLLFNEDLGIYPKATPFASVKKTFHSPEEAAKWLQTIEDEEWK